MDMARARYATGPGSFPAESKWIYLLSGIRWQDGPIHDESLDLASPDCEQ